MLKMETEEVAKEYGTRKRRTKTAETAALEDEAATGSADLVQMYLKEIGRISLLTAEEEIKLAKANEKGICLQTN
jgi:hypothetical protein